jgi:aminoglycoside phosphotransferase (APT) family kinase protein
MGVIPEWVRGGWEVMEELLDRDAFTHLKSLTENPQPLFDALSRCPYTLLHGDYRAENLAHPDRPIAFDWQEATRSLMTIDLAWFAKQGFVQNAMGQVPAIDYYRTRLETYLDRHFDDAEWQTMIDLGYLVDALRSTCFSAYWYKHSDDPNDRPRLEREVTVRNQQVRDASRWIV